MSWRLELEESCYKNKLHNCQYCWPILESHKKRKFVEDRIGFGFRYFERGTKEIDFWESQEIHVKTTKPNHSSQLSACACSSSQLLNMLLSILRRLKGPKKTWNRHKLTLPHSDNLIMSLNYLDESDTDEEGGKVSKCYSEIEISTAQMRSSDLKGAVMKSSGFHILSMLSRVKSFDNFSRYLPIALRNAWQVVSIWTTPFIRNDACSGGKCCVFIGKLWGGLASLYWCIGCIKSCWSAKRSYHIIEQKRYIHQLKEVRVISDISCE